MADALYCWHCKTEYQLAVGVCPKCGKPLTPGEGCLMTPQELVQLQRETRSSIELTRNAKGDYQWVIKRYHENTDEDQRKALADIRATDAQLRLDYLPGPAS